MGANKPVRVKRGQFARNGSMRDRLNSRLVNEKRYDDYLLTCGALVLAGVDKTGDMAAWKVAALAFAALNGDRCELESDPWYEEIIANWVSGMYPKPIGMAKFPTHIDYHWELSGTSPPKSLEKFEAAKVTKKVHADDWEALADLVGDRQASELDITRWVVGAYSKSFDKLDPDDIPSSHAVSILKWAKLSPSNFGVILGGWFKLLPDKKSVEYDAKRKDTGQDISLLDDFLKGLANEEPEEEWDAA